MNTKLQQAIQQASELPDDLQEKIGKQFLSILNEVKDDIIIDFRNSSILNLERAYSSDEPSYTQDDIKEINPEFHM